MIKTALRSSFVLALGLVAAACSEPTSDIDVALEVVAAPGPAGGTPSGSAQTCLPRQPIDPALCDPQEPLPPQPRPGGSCTFEISLASIENTSGQGASEGLMELNVVTTANGDSLTWPSEHPVPGFFNTRDVIPGTDVGVLDGLITTVTVAAGDQEVVPLCATFTEDDNGGLNGGDDTGQACTSVTVSAHARPNGNVVCRISDPAPSAEAQLCGDNQCNGRFEAHWQVLAEDADQDCVPNEDDFTPELCDEELKGQLGRASLIWFHMGDGPMTTFYQSMGTDLSKATTGYDYVVIVIDPTYAGPFLLNAQAINAADLILSPFEAELYLGMQEITSRGYDMDIWVFSHGYETIHDQNPPAHEHTNFVSLDTNECGSSSAEVCWNATDDDGDGITDENDGVYDHEIIENLDPARIGTDLVPIRMVYSIACFNEGMNHAWTEVGAKVTSGTVGINFFPVFYGGFADAWNTASSYDSSVAQSDKPGDRGWVYTWIETQSQGFDCDDIDLGGNEETLSVLGLNACAEDYFVDSDGNGADASVYNIGADAYDSAVSGAVNVERESERTTDGDGTIKKFVPATLSW